jgi:hypothetical protein
MSSTTSPTALIIDRADDLWMWLEEAERAVRNAWELQEQLHQDLGALEDELLEAGKPAALVGAAEREAASIFTDFPGDVTFAHAVKDAAELKELVRLAAEQLAKLNA